MAERNRLREFIDSEAASAMPLLAAAVAALVLANSPFADAVGNLLRIRFGFSLGPVVLDKSVLLWINDGLMALFFLLVGLEIKREVV
ncbi:MAG TPA: Na+/H+ antiporter NhaA, partial [Reyranella sp.]|nr:Na+/H+ antiporter NhaA [Reyranella sp.]